ncbi:fimbrial protein [Serratia proteamaculans]|uniref:fimbrial protein n=1 Tax=Serratia proteamaculans TaxID=28151 RepID=UPI003CED90DD
MMQRQHRTHLQWGARVPALLLTLLIATGVQAATIDNLRFDGTLVADPCELDPKTTDISLDFGTVIDKYLYLNTRTHSKPITIRLLGCDLSLGKTVSLTFKGTESVALPGLLAVDTGGADGIAIGMELADGTPLPINKATPLMALTKDTTTLTLMNYVQGEPKAIKDHKIVTGDFTAVATFALDYL